MFNILKFIIATALMLYIGQKVNQSGQEFSPAMDDDDFFTLSTPAAIHFLNKEPKKKMDCIRNIKKMTGRTVIEIPALQLSGVSGNL
ncbi:MAG TPA: hypothetical protein PLC48_00785 [Ferruginibacter sp.]|nr:hypothetical protein [Ferruginibacter sp.]